MGLLESLHTNNNRFRRQRFPWMCLGTMGSHLIPTYPHPTFPGRVVWIPVRSAHYAVYASAAVPRHFAFQTSRA